MSSRAKKSSGKAAPHSSSPTKGLKKNVSPGMKSKKKSSACQVFVTRLRCGDLLAYVVFHESNNQPYLVHLINTLEDKSNDRLNAIGINFHFRMRDPSSNRPRKGSNGYFRDVFVKVLGDSDEASPEQFGQDLAAVLTEIDQGKTFEHAGDITNTDEPDPACRFVMDKDVTEMAFDAYEDAIRDGSFFEETEIVEGYFGDHASPKQVMQQYKDF